MLALAFAAALSICGSSPRINCVVDGDTFWRHGVKIRIADIDTPETDHAKCPSERALGLKAKYRLLALLNAQPYRLQRRGRDKDRNGRLLRVVKQHGRSVGQRLIDEGLARPWAGARRPWCAHIRQD